MMDEYFGQVTKALQLNIKLGHDTSSDYKALKEAIATRVAELLESDPALLFSSLYRLDVPEAKVRQVMSNRDVNDPIAQIAELILQRQIERAQTKITLRQKPIKGWEW